MYKKIIICFLILGTFIGCLSASPTETQKPLHLIMHERDFMLSTYYQIDSDETPLGNIIKTKLSLRTSYEYHYSNGALGSNAYLRIMSLGSMFTWAGVMDIYDENGDRLGLIEGAVVTLLPSKFSFYDNNNKLVAVAYMDKDCMGFTITDPYNDFRTIAHLHRIFVRDVVDHWTISVFDRITIDPRLLYTFCAFALDNQGDFKEDI